METRDIYDYVNTMFESNCKVPVLEYFKRMEWQHEIENGSYCNISLRNMSLRLFNFL
ncbi:hypothetical protein SAMN04488137_3097 [Fictibacillus solisalsi]|uniref:Uncharacterized protein n=1 Tax=Fictibacillus solisalsi TaxID=459525 RepID=A0A1G9Y0M5_9BACL|nr:hypothetical protein SAMN04488137_3097 [Fictibacillus solisalsi]